MAKRDEVSKAEVRKCLGNPEAEVDCLGDGWVRVGSVNNVCLDGCSGGVWSVVVNGEAVYTGTCAGAAKAYQAALPAKKPAKPVESAKEPIAVKKKVSKPAKKAAKEKK